MVQERRLAVSNTPTSARRIRPAGALAAPGRGSTVGRDSQQRRCIQPARCLTSPLARSCGQRFSWADRDRLSTNRIEAEVRRPWGIVEMYCKVRSKSTTQFGRRYRIRFSFRRTLRCVEQQAFGLKPRRGYHSPPSARKSPELARGFRAWSPSIGRPLWSEIRSRAGLNGQIGGGGVLQEHHGQFGVIAKSWSEGKAGELSSDAAYSGSAVPAGAGRRTRSHQPHRLRGPF